MQLGKKTGENEDTSAAKKCPVQTKLMVPEVIMETESTSPFINFVT